LLSRLKLPLDWILKRQRACWQPDMALLLRKFAMTDLDETFGYQDHINHARNVARASIAGLLAIAFCNGAANGYFSKHHLAEPGAVAALFFASVMALTYLWYYYDSIERCYLRTRGLNLGIIMLSIVAVPYYLTRSRPQGQRLKSILRLFGFALSYIICAIVGVLLVKLVGVF
jgi:hypothetical protein